MEATTAPFAPPAPPPSCAAGAASSPFSWRLAGACKNATFADAPPATTATVTTTIAGAAAAAAVTSPSTAATRAIRLSTTKTATQPGTTATTTTAAANTATAALTTTTKSQTALKASTTTHSAGADGGRCWHCAAHATAPRRQQEQQPTRQSTACDTARQRRQWRWQVAARTAPAPALTRMPSAMATRMAVPPAPLERWQDQATETATTSFAVATAHPEHVAVRPIDVDSSSSSDDGRCSDAAAASSLQNSNATISPQRPTVRMWRDQMVTAVLVDQRRQHDRRVPVPANGSNNDRSQLDKNNTTNATIIDSQTTTLTTSRSARRRPTAVTTAAKGATLDSAWCFKKNGDILMSECKNSNKHLSDGAKVDPAATSLMVTESRSCSIVTHVANRAIKCCRQLWQSTMPLPAASSRLWALLLLMLTASTAVDSWAGRQDVLSNCTFPVRWEGSWFLSGYQQSIHIKGSQFSYRGKCAASDGNKYLIVDEKGCHRCLVIYEKHKNVLQYKESECEGDSMYMHQSNPSAMAMHSVLKQNNNGGDHRGGAHPNTNNNNGHSRLSSSDQYIMRSNDDMNDYFCKGRETLQNLCDQIPGDALLYSLFRENAEPVKCPLKGPFIFTYNRGHGECKNPVSNIESCTEDSRLLLSFQACHDVQGTESTVEELTCLADWKDGNSRYLVGLVSHHHAISNEERYRCFVYEKINSLMGGPSMLSSTDAEYKLAQSGDATCNGLDSAEVGSRIMSLRKPPLTERCDFPVWFKGPRNWQALMGNGFYNYHTNDGSVHIFNSNGYMETRALCEQINKQTSTEMMAVVHYTTGCKSGFMCMMFYRRDTHVIEIQSGRQASRLEDACAPDHFDVHKMPYLTLLASNPDPQICPLEGLYNLRGAIGPPYMATRHKRNHNNNNRAGHAGHSHHHLIDGGGFANGGVVHKRHSTLRYRGAEVSDDRGTWPANTRGLQPARSRREATSTTTIAPMVNTELIAPTTVDSVDSNPLPVLITPGPVVLGNETGLQRRSRRNAPLCVTNYKAQRQLWVGCTEPNVIDVRPLCNEDGDEEYSCHGSWTENGTVYIIARHKGVNKHGVCISYRPTEGNAAKLVVGDACYRGSMKPPDHHLVANLSVFGKCGDTSSAATTLELNGNCWLALVAALLGAVLYCQQLSRSSNAGGSR